MSQSNLAVKQAEVPNKLVQHNTNVHKFGGSSLASAACIDRAVKIISEHCRLNDIIVVSANGKMTDLLIALYQHALEQNSKFLSALAEIKQYQTQLIESVLTTEKAKQLITQLNEDIALLVQWLNISPAQYETQTLAFGELWSARLLATVLNEQVCPAKAIDAREFLVVDNENTLNVNYDLSAQQFNLLQQPQSLSVVTGFIAKDKHNNCCTLGRNGSDYSATILAALTKANRVTLWTDVDGIYSADPRIVPSARKLHRIPNEVAQELGRLGNPVLHEKTMGPLQQHQTHLHVANSLHAIQNGTEIGHFGAIAQQELSITHLNDVLTVHSDLVNKARVDEIETLFSPLAIDISQSIIVIRQSQQKTVSDWFASQHHKVTFAPVSLIAVVGHNVAQRGEIRAKLKRALSKHSLLYILAAANQHSLLAVVNYDVNTELVNHVHRQVTKNSRTIGLVVAGLGNIGQVFLSKLPQQIARVSALENVHLVGLLNSKQALISNDGIELTGIENQFEQQAKPYNNEQLFHWLSGHPFDELVIVDITPSEQFSALYSQFFALGIHVIGANKWAASSDTSQYQQLLEQTQKNQCVWLGNTTVGAGLPVNYAIKDLRNSGDTITEISGIFSGTLSWLFQTFQKDTPFSTLVTNALAQGITEPDPREDLSGRDVQRKLLILAREAGFTLSLNDIECQNLVPEALQKVSKTEFLQRLPELDDYFLEQFTIAEKNNKTLRYIAQFSTENGVLKASVKLAYLSLDHPFATITAGDNIFQIKSHWYQHNPLIIRGPGAGKEVTAGGLHSDLVTLCQQLVSKQPHVKIEGIN